MYIDFWNCCFNPLGSSQASSDHSCYSFSNVSANSHCTKGKTTIHKVNEFCSCWRLIELKKIFLQKSRLREILNVRGKQISHSKSFAPLSGKTFFVCNNNNIYLWSKFKHNQIDTKCCTNRSRLLNTTSLLMQILTFGVNSAWSIWMDI